jgi:hypothetical protein
MDAEVFIEAAQTAAARKRWQQVEEHARLQTAEHIFPKIADVVNARTRIVDHPPLVYHPRANELLQTRLPERPIRRCTRATKDRRSLESD